MAAGVRLPEINFVLLAGRATRDAEMFRTQSGLAKLTIRMAINRRVKDSKTGEWKDDAFYIDAIAWKEMAERAQDKAKKGAALIVEGRLTSRDYEDKTSGSKRTVFEVMANRLQFLSTAQDQKSASAPSGGESTASPSGDAADIEEVPF